MRVGAGRPETEDGGGVPAGLVGGVIACAIVASMPPGGVEAGSGAGFTP